MAAGLARQRINGPVFSLISKNTLDYPMKRFVKCYFRFMDIFLKSQKAAPRLALDYPQALSCQGGDCKVFV